MLLVEGCRDHTVLDLNQVGLLDQPTVGIIVAVAAVRGGGARQRSNLRPLGCKRGRQARTAPLYGSARIPEVALERFTSYF